MRNSFRNHLHSILFRIFTICTIIGLNCNLIFASSTVGQLNQSVSFDFLSIASFKASSNAYFSNTQADPTYLTTASLLGSFINTFGPKYSYSINSFVQGTPAGYTESKDVNLHLRDISSNQWYINDNIMRIRDYMGPISQVVSDIKTNTTNTAAATNAALTLMGDLQNINWVSGPWQFEYYTTPSGFQPSLDTAYSYQTYPRLYVRFGAGTLVGQNVFKVAIPITAASNDNRNNFIDHVALYRDNVLLTDDYIDYYYSPELQQIYLYFKSIPSYGFNIAIFFNNNWILRSGTPTIEYIPYDTMDYYLVSYLGALNEIADKDFTAEIGEININDSINETPINLDVQIGINDFNEVNTISNKLRTWLSTGVGVSALIGALDQLDDSFFTLHNRSIIETINTGYTDFYD